MSVLSKKNFRRRYRQDNKRMTWQELRQALDLPRVQNVRLGHVRHESAQSSREPSEE